MARVVVRGSLVDIVIPICGIRGCLSGYIRDVISRACRGLRVVVVSSDSPSGYPTVYST